MQQNKNAHWSTRERVFQCEFLLRQVKTSVTVLSSCLQLRKWYWILGKFQWVTMMGDSRWNRYYRKQNHSMREYVMISLM